MKVKNEKIKNEKSKTLSVKDQVENKNLDARDKLKLLKGELDKLKLDHIQGKLKNTSFLTIKRKEIAKLLTAMQSKNKK